MMEYTIFKKHFIIQIILEDVCLDNSFVSRNNSIISIINSKNIIVWKSN